MAKANMVPMK